MISDFVVSLIRTWTPLAMGAALTWLAAGLGVVVTPESSAGVVALSVGVVTAAYYWLARWLESRFPWLGFLLGKPSKPTYQVTSKQQGKVL